MINEAPEKMINLFKELKVSSIRSKTGNPFNAVGNYDEVADIEGNKFHISCEITEDDINLLYT